MLKNVVGTVIVMVSAFLTENTVFQLQRPTKNVVGTVIVMVSPFLTENTVFQSQRPTV